MEEKGNKPDEFKCPLAKMDETSQIIRRQDIKDLADTFTEALSPLDRIISLMQQQNVDWKSISRSLKWNTAWMVILSVGFTSGLAFQYANNRAVSSTAQQQQEVLAASQRLQKDLADVTLEVENLVVMTRSTKRTVEGLEEEKDTSPKIEVVAETDPVKARRAPVKLRVTAPPAPVMPKPVSSTEQAVEIPIPARQF